MRYSEHLSQSDFGKTYCTNNIARIPLSVAAVPASLVVGHDEGEGLRCAATELLLRSF